jgi:hypothetical protein
MRVRSGRGGATGTIRIATGSGERRNLARRGAFQRAMMRIAVAALVAAAVAAPAAAAAPPWSAPQTLSSPHLFVDGPGITFSNDGSALATWGAAGRDDGARARRERRRVQGSRAGRVPR